MYHLKEMIGEDKVNAALRKLIEKFGGKSSPYATSLDLIGLLREQTPPELEYLIDDLFMDITLYENRMEYANCQPLKDGKFEIEFQFNSEKFKADGKGTQKPVELNDWVDVAAFAKPERSNRYGKQLYRKRVRCTDRVNRMKIVLDECPWEVVVDPDFLLIDRELDNNRVRVEKE